MNDVSVRLGHLKDGIKPIMTCIGTEELLESADFENAEKIDYFGDPQGLIENDFKSGGSRTYVISPVDSLDKFSENFNNCTGMLISGIEKKTGKEISFLSHQDPKYLFDKKEHEDSFRKDFGQSLKELKERTEEGTVDALIFGGNCFKDSEYFERCYFNSIQLVAEEFLKNFDFEPVVVTGPKGITGDDSVLYKNDSRRFYMARPVTGDKTSEAFLPSEAKEKRKELVESQLSFKDAMIAHFEDVFSFNDADREKALKIFEQVFHEELEGKERDADFVNVFNRIESLFAKEEISIGGLYENVIKNKDAGKEVISQFLDFINGLNISLEEKELLNSIINNSRSGEIEFFVDRQSVSSFRIPRDGVSAVVAMNLGFIIEEFICKVKDKEYGFGFLED